MAPILYWSKSHKRGADQQHWTIAASLAGLLFLIKSFNHCIFFDMDVMKKPILIAYTFNIDRRNIQGCFKVVSAI